MVGFIGLHRTSIGCGYASAPSPRSRHFFPRTSHEGGGLLITLCRLPQMRCYLFLSFTPPQVAHTYLAAFPGSIDVVALIKCDASQDPGPLSSALKSSALSTALVGCRVQKTTGKELAI